MQRVRRVYRVLCSKLSETYLSLHRTCHAWVTLTLSRYATVKFVGRTGLVHSGGV